MNQQLHQLFIKDIQDLYSGEQQIIQALPKIIEKTSDKLLKSSFEAHLEETQEQTRLLEELANEFDFDPNGKHCAGMEGILKEGEEAISEMEPSPILDLALIGAAQRVEHYEIAGYGTVVNYAQEMGHENAQKLLHDILREEKETDEKLTKLAEQIITNLESEITSPIMA